MSSTRIHLQSRVSSSKTYLSTIQLMSTADIHITLTKPHADLQPDMSLFAQLIIDGNLVLQTIPAKRDELQDSWNLIFECNVPLRVLTFAIAIMRQSRHRGIRLLGFVEIQREDVLISTGESGLRRQLENVNIDGASLDFLSCFSLSETSTPTIEAFNSFDVTDGTQIQSKATYQFAWWVIHLIG
ncbi:hypothetical protein B0H11DRAFT_1899178 [Mycena galericulata]|nr:hypothetical protein B0H11DRAFT_1899178 [Mycena galericulata]